MSSNRVHRRLSLEELEPRIALSAVTTSSNDKNWVTAEWSFLLYLDGDNDLEESAINDFLEIGKTTGLTGPGAPVRVLTQFDRICEWWDNEMRYGDWSTTKRFEITKGLIPDPVNAIADLGELNMGDPSTLMDFVNWGISYAPANHYALILWDHGSGWPGLCYDNTNNDHLTIREVRAALEGVDTKIDIIGFDACLMSMLEVGYEIRNEGRIMVASQETIPLKGWAYHTLLAGVVKTPTMTPAQVSQLMVSTYSKSYGSKSHITLSAVDLTKMDVLGTALDNLAEVALAQNNDWPAIFAARHEAGFINNHSSYRDLRTFISRLSAIATDDQVRAAAHQVNNIINDGLIIANYSKPANLATGLSIYFPENNDTIYEVNSDYNVSNVQFAETDWRDFLVAFIAASPFPAEVLYYHTNFDPPETIPDKDTATWTIEVLDSFPIIDLDVLIDIGHPCVKDLRATLTGPDGTCVKLFTHVGKRGGHFDNTIFDDQCSVTIASVPPESAPFASFYKPQGKLSAFTGKDAQGTWTLQIWDDAAWDEGALYNWGLIFHRAYGLPLLPGKAATFGDSDGSIVSVKLTGQGYGYVSLTSENTIDRIILEGTGANSALAITAKGGDGGVTVEGGISIRSAPFATDALGNITAKGVTFGTGSGVHVDRSVKTISADAFQSGSCVDVSGNLGTLTINKNAVGLAVRSTQGLGKLTVLNMLNSVISASTIGTVTVSANLSDSLIMAGYDIGTDLAFTKCGDGYFAGSKATITSVIVKGTMSRTSIAAGVGCGANGVFGDGDDACLAASMLGNIKTITVKILDTSGGGNYGILALGDIGTYNRQKVTNTPWMWGNLVIREFIQDCT